MIPPRHVLLNYVTCDNPKVKLVLSKSALKAMYYIFAKSKSKLFVQNTMRIRLNRNRAWPITLLLDPLALPVMFLPTVEVW